MIRSLFFLLKSRTIIIIIITTINVINIIRIFLIVIVVEIHHNESFLKSCML